MRLLYCSLILLLPLVYSFDTDDLEIYDLFEEVKNGTFYDLLEIENTANTAEIRRAYRKKSKEIHPDRNKAENAAEMFRQLVGVYEILKNPERREKYENVLKNGLPDWRQPIYYYRKYRKMGTLEISILVSLIATFGHYIAWWAAYLEKYWEMSERLEPERRKRDRKRKRQTEDEEGPDELDVAYRLECDLNYRKPGRWDFLPFVLMRGTKSLVLSVPEFIRQRKEAKRMEAERIQREEEELREAAEKAAQPKPKRVKQPKVIRVASEHDDEAWLKSLATEVDEEGKKVKKELKKSEWTEDDIALLAKVMAKYPGGTPGRWDRIAHDLGRSASDVTKKVKMMKESLARNFTSSEGQPGADRLVTKKLDINISDTMATKALDNELNKTSFFMSDNCYQSPDDIPDDLDEGTSYQEAEEDYYVPKKKNKVKTRPVDETKVDEQKDDQDREATENEDESNNTEENKEEAVVEDLWTQIQQKCLESSIQQFPKSTAERWTCIARAVPGKTKEQCIARFKKIAEQIKQRKSKQGKGS